MFDITKPTIYKVIEEISKINILEANEGTFKSEK